MKPIKAIRPVLRRLRAGSSSLLWEGLRCKNGLPKHRVHRGGLPCTWAQRRSFCDFQCIGWFYGPCPQLHGKPPYLGERHRAALRSCPESEVDPATGAATSQMRCSTARQTDPSCPTRRSSMRGSCGDDLTGGSKCTANHPSRMANRPICTANHPSPFRIPINSPCVHPCAFARCLCW